MRFKPPFGFTFAYIFLSQCPYSVRCSENVNTLITPAIDDYIKTAIQQWNLTGLSIALVRRDPNSTTGWYQEFASYGIARTDGTPVTPDTLFAWGSNAKLFTAMATGLLFSNETVQKGRDSPLSWTTKAKDVYGDLWGLWDKDASNGVTIQDMLSHRTGLPRHDGSDIPRKGGLAEAIKTLRYLRPSAELREIYQYNNLMYNTLGYLPHLLVNQSLGSYVDQHIFKPLNMSTATYSIQEAEERPIAHGFQVSGQDLRKELGGVKMEVVPFYVRPGDEQRNSGSGGVLGSARDAATWLSTLMALGQHPHTSEQIIPAEVVEHTTTGVSVAAGMSIFPERSVAVYGAGQTMYSYRGCQLIDHGGNEIGFSSEITRLPNNNLGIALLNNDWVSNSALVSIMYRLVDEIVIRAAVPESPVIDWISRYKLLLSGSPSFTPRPEPPKLPAVPFTKLDGRIYNHPTYGSIQPCYVHNAPAPGANQSRVAITNPDSNCTRVLGSLPVQRILNVTDLSIPTYIAEFKSAFTTHLRLSHFSGNLFNVSIYWTNGQVRLDEGLGSIEGGEWKDDGDVVLYLEDHLLEWVTGGEEGLALKGDMWGMGDGAKEPSGEGKKGAEVWVPRVVG